MQIPEKINILGFDYKVILTEENLILDGRACNGIVDYHLQTITIRIKDRNEQRILHTFIHEIIHVIEYCFDRHNEVTELTEWQVDMLATGLAGMWDKVS